MRAAAAPDPSPAPARSMLKRLFDRQLLRVSPAERIVAVGGGEKDEVEPSSVCLDGMVRSFLEDGSGVGAAVERAGGHGARRCNCFHGGGSSDDDDDEDDAAASSDVAETIKGLVHCATLRERNLLADVCGHVERHRAGGARRRELLGLVAASLRAAGHDAAVCVSRWDKSPTHPAGEHAYVDVLLPPASDRGARERVLVDVDFRSAFEVARPTKAYRALLQRLPAVFVGKDDRLRLLVAASADAARASLRKRGLHLPPWRKPEYMRAKWLSPYDREPAPPDEASASAAAAEVAGEEAPAAA
ncbi:uncharacterized protein [Oryza sativa Japonica Group]|jgi:uncharacterized protein (TIGR01615 family)|uniref:Os10g0417800 protein n=6 Tax=Oryza TaxID=4527 RepID=Q7XEK8_ORYSJ|nr:uncharacterized protein LOC4348637 [Oryza sativa Japonica Group]XP_052168965.1 uncharacterized protein LOC127785610 [Oryza glaberrima]AAP53781.1 uncharacterized plant-specific domain TIGR01615 family protein, expressed [Oryza sativa Japonica Group]KAF2913602.1 hypothetical protein DAI22_10g097700 [Oryza sativa Japonica Group]BAF26524.1 Os10g0417800 [Oryza sativa Japonica Group]BAG90623.1 unnamed protein product [Oryza sativa Japonica Group]BAT10867.1 Os10g0417800 [Oryza sativa Japonica Gro|eukprot:NP_001064610.1 Os10g0417800 [Oryza sativa Japonica Group]